LVFDASCFFTSASSCSIFSRASGAIDASSLCYSWLFVYLSEAMAVQSGDRQQSGNTEVRIVVAGLIGLCDWCRGVSSWCVNDAWMMMMMMMIRDKGCEMWNSPVEFYFCATLSAPLCRVAPLFVLFTSRAAALSSFSFKFAATKASDLAFAAWSFSDSTFGDPPPPLLLLLLTLLLLLAIVA
jgi:hypothetical protein